MRSGSFRNTPNARSGSSQSTLSTSKTPATDFGSAASPGGQVVDGTSPSGLIRSRGHTPTMGTTPRVEATKLAHQETLSENAILKARVNSLTEELRTTRDICSRQHRVRRVASPNRNVSPKGRSRSPGKGGAEVMTFITYKDSDTQTKSAQHHSMLTQTLDTEYLDGASDEVRRLKAEILRSHAECASLQHALQQLRNSILGTDRVSDTTDAVEHARREADERIHALHRALEDANAEIRNRQDEIRSLNIVANRTYDTHAMMYNKAMMTDEPLLPTSLPVTQGPVQALGDMSNQQQKDEVASLNRALELAKSQLRQARSDLTQSRKEAKIGGNLPSLVSTENIGIMVDTQYDYEKLFRIYKREFNPSVVESMLIEVENAAERRSAEDSMKNALRNVSTLDDADDMKRALDGARVDLVEAHGKIDELHYALDLERRERAQFGSGGAGPESRQATAEISFLCDTLAATRSELELLQRKTTEAEAERDAAVSSFADLKGRTQSMFEECQDITESTRRETDISINALSANIRQKDHEVHTLRGQIAALHRNLETTTAQRDSCQKDADAFKARVTALTSSVARLREDYNAQSSALREARSFAASFSSLAMQSPRTGTSGQPGSPAVSKPRAGSVTVAGAEASASPARKNKPAATGSSPSSIQALAASLKHQDNRSGSLEKKGSPRGGAAAVVDDAVLAELKEEYEELKSCFLMLCPLVPNAETAREVAAGVVAGVDKLNSRIAALEKEIKKKTIALQTEKKDSVALKDTIHSMQRKSDLADDLARRVEEKDRTTEKAKRMLAVAHGDYEKTRHEAEEKQAILEEELRHAKGQLAQAKQELSEGREMMVTLLQEDETALKESERIMNTETDSEVGVPVASA